MKSKISKVTRAFYSILEEENNNNSIENDEENQQNKIPCGKRSIYYLTVKCLSNTGKLFSISLQNLVNLLKNKSASVDIFKEGVNFKEALLSHKLEMIEVN